MILSSPCLPDPHASTSITPRIMEARIAGPTLTNSLSKATQISFGKGLAYKVVPRLREFSKQVEAEVVSNSRSKIHQTWDLILR